MSDQASWGEIARHLVGDHVEDLTLQRVVESAVDVVPHTGFASLSLRKRRGRVTTAATTDDRAVFFDARQYELGEGPCLDAIREDRVYLSNDLSRDERWPVWGPLVAKQGVGAIIAVQLRESDTRVLGSLNLYAEAPASFDADDLDLAVVYSVHATNAMVSSRLVTGLQTAVESRHQIGLAQGILMATYGLDAARAFSLLSRYSSSLNLKLREVAAQVVEKGALPDGLEATAGGVPDEAHPLD